jgi:hypothetical protein
MATRRSSRVVGVGSSPSAEAADPLDKLVRENTLLKQQLAAALANKARRSDMDLIDANEYQGGEVRKITHEMRLKEYRPSSPAFPITTLIIT